MGPPFAICRFRGQIERIRPKKHNVSKGNSPNWSQENAKRTNRANFKHVHPPCTSVKLELASSLLIIEEDSGFLLIYQRRTFVGGYNKAAVAEKREETQKSSPIDKEIGYMRENGTICPFGTFAPIYSIRGVKIGFFTLRTVAVLERSAERAIRPFLGVDKDKW